jgi:hypothetical protein
MLGREYLKVSRAHEVLSVRNAKLLRANELQRSLRTNAKLLLMRDWTKTPTYHRVALCTERGIEVLEEDAMAVQ